MFAGFLQRLIKKTNVCSTMIDIIDLQDGRYFYFICLPINQGLCYNYQVRSMYFKLKGGETIC
ncbi:MAG: hypothetical protein PHD29_04985 [bacterium]|nr:hypothetical protein [bacterium]MDD5354530.1 hypothetical protein [bacterium]MDD5755905.1 hypothetical protein [bacterium]